MYGFGYPCCCPGNDGFGSGSNWWAILIIIFIIFFLFCGGSNRGKSDLC